MKFLVLLAGIFIVSVCVTFFLFPSLVEELIKWVGRKRNLNYIVALRLSCGTIFLLGADTTRYPQTIWWLGILFIVAGLVLLAFRAKTIRELTAIWLDKPAFVVRSWVALPLTLGIFVIYAVM